MLRLLFLCVCLVPAIAFGQAKAIVKGPTEVAPGDLVVLDATESVAHAYEWTLPDSQKTFLPVEGGTKLVFSTGAPGHYTFVLSVAHCEGIADEKAPCKATVAVATHTVTVGKPKPPEPDPDPDPDPDDPPTPPADPIAKAIFDAAMKLDKTNRAQEAKAISLIYREVASEGAALTNTNNVEMQKKVDTRMLSLAAEVRAKWIPVGEILDDLGDKNIRDRETAVSVYNKFAEGLEAVR